MSIGKAMADARVRAGLSQYRLAARSGVEQNYISQYERDKHVPSITNTVRLADALGISIDEYIGREI